MNKILYYVVEKLTQDVGDDIHELTGWKTITVYTIENNKLVKFFDIEGENSLNTEDEIQDYLDDNGYGDEDIKFVEL